jgi:hypothetical protein
MPLQPVFRYFVDIRLSNQSDNRKSLHIDACSRTGAIYQALLLVKAHNIKDIYAIVVREKAYPISKRTLSKTLREQNKTEFRNKNNLKAIESIKIGLKTINEKKPNLI